MSSVITTTKCSAVSIVCRQQQYETVTPTHKTPIDLSSDILPVVNDGASHARLRWFGNLRLQPDVLKGVPRPRYSYPAKDLEVLGYFLSVWYPWAYFLMRQTPSQLPVVGLSNPIGYYRIDSHRNTVWERKPSDFSVCNQRRRCIPALKGEVLAPAIFITL